MDENANVRPFVTVAGTVPMYVPEGVTPEGMSYWLDTLEFMYGPPLERGGPPLTLSN